MMKGTAMTDLATPQPDLDQTEKSCLTCGHGGYMASPICACCVRDRNNLFQFPHWRHKPTKADDTPLRDLYDRLDAATGPDRELDRAIALSLDGYVVRRIGGLPHFTVPEEMIFAPAGKPAAVPAYTASLDAVKLLHERLLPGWEWDLEMNQGKFYSVIIPQNLDDDLIAKDAPTPALAWLKAIVEALIVEAENG